MKKKKKTAKRMQQKGEADPSLTDLPGQGQKVNQPKEKSQPNKHTKKGNGKKRKKKKKNER